MTNSEFIEKLKYLANKPCWLDEDDFNAMDFSGGNFDDAFYGGVNAGKTRLARELLQDLGVER